jgi:hypothetical protein
MNYTYIFALVNLCEAIEEKLEIEKTSFPLENANQ